MAPRADLVLHSKFVYADGAIREMILWKLPSATPERSHGFKYRLYYGLADGSCLVRYDNESGKGDHRHFRTSEESYSFTDVESLVRDFLRDVSRLREGAA